MGGQLKVKLFLSDLVTQASLCMELKIVGWFERIVTLKKTEMLENSV